VLQRGAAAAAVSTGQAQDGNFGSSEREEGGALRTSGSGLPAADEDEGESATAGGGGAGSGNAGAHEGRRSSGRRVWVRAAEALVLADPDNVWDPNWRSTQGRTQMHLLLSAFPPAKQDAAAYRFLLASAQDANLSPVAEDAKGRIPLFCLCEQMAAVPASECAEAARILKMVLGGGGGLVGVGGSDRSGKTVFDIQEQVPRSCLSEMRYMLVDATMGHGSSKSTSAGINSSRGGGGGLGVDMVLKPRKGDLTSSSLNASAGAKTSSSSSRHSNNNNNNNASSFTNSQQQQKSSYQPSTHAHMHDENVSNRAFQHSSSSSSSSSLGSGAESRGGSGSWVRVPSSQPKGGPPPPPPPSHHLQQAQAAHRNNAPSMSQHPLLRGGSSRR